MESISNPVYNDGTFSDGLLEDDVEVDDTLAEKTPMLYTNESKEHSTSKYLYFLALFAAIGGFLFGYDTGVISGAMIPIKRKFHLSYEMQEVIVSITLVGAIIGAASSAYFNDRFGRRAVLLLASALFTVGSVCMGAAEQMASIIVGRMFVGLGIGYASMTVPIYIAEVAPSHIRGKLVTLNQLFITFGIFLAAVMNSLFSYVETDGWRYMLGVSGIPSIIMFTGFLFMPESPRWLIINNDLEKGRKVLQSVRGNVDVEVEFQRIVSSIASNKTATEHIQHNNVFIMSGAYVEESFFETLKKMSQISSARRALVIGCCLQAFQQLSAINTVMYYSGSIIELTGVEDQTTILWMATAVASGNFIATLISIKFIEKIGRRRLMLLSLAGVCVGLCLLAATFFLIKQQSTAVTFTASLEDTGLCSQYSKCYGCVRDRKCGFCYLQHEDKIQKASCLLLNTSSRESHPSFCTASRYLNGTTEKDVHWSDTTCPTSYAWLAVFAMVFYLIMFAPGVGPLPWAINAEIFPLWARSVGVAAATSTNWIFNLIVSFTFLNVIELLTEGGAFVLYAVLSTIGVIIFFLFLPETKGVKLEKTYELFEGPLLVPCRGS